MTTVNILLPNHLDHGFDYAVPEGMNLNPGDYAMVPFGTREMPGVVWGKGELGAGTKIKPVKEKLEHLPPMSKVERDWVDWVAWYTLSPRGAVMKMCLPLPDALKPPSKRERPPKLLAGPKTKNALTVPTLSGAQQDAAATLCSKYNQGFSVTLLDGVTGSGKTEVYFALIAQALAEGKQALVLLPEIGLSVQWLKRFEKRFGFTPIIWHSSISPAARKHAWRAIIQGEGRVVVGARSALFLPYPKLGAMVIDEEHDASFKQEDGVIYHARDMAIARAKFEKIPIVLSSATPSLETVHNVIAGKFARVHLPDRHGGAVMPSVQMIDMRSAELERGAFIASPLRALLAQNLARGEQSMLFLNRRGYAPLVLCRTCGHRFQCPQCSAWMVLHKKLPRLHCHHCDHVEPAPKTCPACQGVDTLFPCGPGVERIAEEVQQFLPQARVAILASDATESYSDLQKTIEAMAAGEIDLLIGTQMAAKGHHFAKLTLVGIVDADLGLNGGDVRAAERTYQLLHQLSGRAGREEKLGSVMLQSFAPDHPVMQALLSGDRDQFIALELKMREDAHMPPFSKLAAIIVESVQDPAAYGFARQLAQSAPRIAGFEVLGPAPAPLFMLRGKYRYRLLAHATRELNIQQIMRDWLSPNAAPRNIRVKVDIDPHSFL